MNKIVSELLLNRIGTKSPVACPDCGAIMIYRQNKFNLSIFLGCGRYPECTTTQEISEALILKLQGQKTMFD